MGCPCLRAHFGVVFRETASLGLIPLLVYEKDWKQLVWQTLVHSPMLQNAHYNPFCTKITVILLSSPVSMYNMAWQGENGPLLQKNKCELNFEDMSATLNFIALE